jgi:hypothetical protein
MGDVGTGILVHKKVEAFEIRAKAPVLIAGIHIGMTPEPNLTAIQGGAR